MPTTKPSLSIVKTNKVAFQLAYRNFPFIFTTILLCNLGVPLLLYASAKMFSANPDALILHWGSLLTTDIQDVVLISHVLVNDLWKLLCFGFIPAVITLKVYENYTYGTSRTLLSYIGKACCALPGVLVVQTICTLITTIGMIFLIIPGLIIAAMFACSTPIYLIEGKEIIQCMKNSRKLTKGYKSDIIFFWISAAIITALVVLPFIAIQMIMDLDGLGIGFAVIQNTGTAILATYGFSLNTAIYIRLRQKRDRVVEDAVSTITESEDNTEQISAPLPQQA